MNPIRDNIRGGALTETTFLVLLAFNKPNHGYGVMQLIERETKGRVSLGAGTLYGAINMLLQKNWINPTGNADAANRKEYVATPLGIEIAAKELSRLSEIKVLAEKILGGKDK